MRDEETIKDFLLKNTSWSLLLLFLLINYIKVLTFIKLIKMYNRKPKGILYL